MRTLLTVLLIVCAVRMEALSFPWSKTLEQPTAEGVTFQLADGWHWVTCEAVPEVVLSATTRRGCAFPPSVNLIIEKVDASANVYLERPSEKIESEDSDLVSGVQCSCMGELATGLGIAKLTLLEANTALGPMRALQAICIQDDKAYLITAAAHSDSFSTFYDSFLEMIASLQRTD